jgi:hypothetical protein
MPEVKARNERARVQELAAENALYCEKFGMKVETESIINACLILGREPHLRELSEPPDRVCQGNTH